MLLIAADCDSVGRLFLSWPYLVKILSHFKLFTHSRETQKERNIWRNQTRLRLSPQYTLFRFSQLMCYAHRSHDKQSFKLWKVWIRQQTRRDMTSHEAVRRRKGVVGGVVSRNSAKLGNYKMPVKFRET